MHTYTLQVKSKQDVQAELDRLHTQISHENSSSETVSAGNVSTYSYREMDTSVQVDGRTGQSSSIVMDDNTDVETSLNNSVAENNATSSKMTPKTSTPSKGKRPKDVAELPSPRIQKNMDLADSDPEISAVYEELSEPEKKKRKRKDFQETWCNQQFVVSKLEGHNDVVCCLDCNQELLLTGRSVVIVKPHLFF